MKRGFIYIITALAIALLACSCIKDGSKTEDTTNKVEVGDAVPVFTITAANSSTGEAFDSESFKGKRSLVFLFWTECGNCAEAMPAVEAAWKEIEDDTDYLFVAIARGDSKSVVDAYFAGHPEYTMNYYADPSRDIFRLFAEKWVPRLYVIDKDGIIEWINIGSSGVSTAKILAHLKK